MANLTPKQIEVLTHFLDGATISRAARKAQVHRSTIYLWLKEDPAFTAGFTRQRTLLAEAVADRLQELHIEALDAIEESLCGPESTPAVRLRAAIFLLKGGAAPLDKNRHFSENPELS